jgi:cytidine deaminase
VKPEQLIALAKEVRERAYVPYSQFKVGSVLLGEDGTVYAGCNVENAAYGPTNCAERTALFRAIADGAAPKSFQAIAVIGDTEQPITPCGICRQVLIELCAPDMPVYMANLKGDLSQTTVAGLLPGAFTSNDLNGGK